jgi:serine protease
MYRHSRLVGILGCAATLAIVGCAANSGNIAPTTSSLTSAQFGASHVLHYMATRNAARTVVPNSGVLFTYFNGPTLLKPKVYYIFWGYKKYGDPDKVAKLLEAFSKVEGGSLHNNDYIQYYDIVDSKKNYPTNPKGQLGGVWFDNTNPVPQNPTDGQVAQESINSIAKFGYDANASYVVATPHGHSSEGFGTQFCAYHSSVEYESQLLSYTNLPYMPDAGTACGANFTQAPKDETSVDEGVTIVEGHEYGESISDPNPGTGWYNFSYGEIGDICAWTDIQNDTFGKKKSYTMQPMYSNASESCVQEYQ